MYNTPNTQTELIQYVGAAMAERDGAYIQHLIETTSDWLQSNEEKQAIETLLYSALDLIEEVSEEDFEERY